MISLENLPGFWFGLLHGFIAWPVLILHIFYHSLKVYTFPNAGGWYDFGFLLGVGVWAGVWAGGATVRT